MVTSVQTKVEHLHTFRAQAVVRFGALVVQRPSVELAEEGCGNEHPMCVSHLEGLDDQTAEGVAFQLTLEQGACRMADKVIKVRVLPNWTAIDIMRMPSLTS